MATPGDSSPDRSAALTQAFIQLTDVLSPGYDVDAALEHLVRVCREVLSADAVGVLLAGPEEQLTVAAYWPDTPPTASLFELDCTAGPGYQAYLTSQTVTVAAMDRPTLWPRFSAAAYQRGYRSAHTVPMRRRADRVGALTLLRSGPDPISAADTDYARALTTMATIGILTARAYRTQTDLSGQLQSALTSRIAIEQAKGLVAAHNSGDLDGAFAVIRTAARNNNLRLHDVANAIITGELSAEEMARREPRH